MDCIPLVIRELRVAIHVAFVLSPEEVPKDVIFEFGYESLERWIILVFTDEQI